MKDTSHYAPAEIHQRYSKSASIAARKLLVASVEGHAFSDFKSLYVVITNQLLEGHGLDMYSWTTVAFGHNVSALQRRCLVPTVVKEAKDCPYRRWVVDRAGAVNHCFSGVQRVFVTYQRHNQALCQHLLVENKCADQKGIFSFLVLQTCKAPPRGEIP